MGILDGKQALITGGGSGLGGGSSDLLFMKTSGALSEIAASPLLAYGAVFRTLLVLQAQTRGVIRAE